MVMSLRIPALRSWSAALVAALLAAACGHGGPPREVAPPPPAPLAPAPAQPPVSSATSLNGYKVAVANQVYHANAAGVFSGRLPPLLRSIVVVKVEIDGQGRLVSANIYRDNGDRETRAIALASLSHAAPLPRPAPEMVRRGNVEYLESWLFRKDGKFQMRSIAEVQAGE
jgi:protein TonB